MYFLTAIWTLQKFKKNTLSNFYIIGLFWNYKTTCDDSMTRMIVGWENLEDTCSFFLWTSGRIPLVDDSLSERRRGLDPTVLVVLLDFMHTIASLFFPDICSDFTEAFVWLLFYKKVYIVMNFINVSKHQHKDILWWYEIVAPVLKNMRIDYTFLTTSSEHTINLFSRPCF